MRPLAVILVVLGLLVAGCSTPGSDPLLDAAIETERWLQASAIETESGLDWPVAPLEDSAGAPHLYSGSPGVVLFLLELHHATGERRYLRDAKRGADHLASLIDETQDTGLYTGIAGIGFVLLETYSMTKDLRYRDAVMRVIGRLETEARDVNGGVEWNEVTDIIAGSAGTGLFLLDAADRLEDPRARALAVRAGEHLLTLAHADDTGLWWSMDPEFPRLMPNFSHGTAGVAYFLARLYEETGHERFLQAAIAGAGHLNSLVADNGLIHHHTPGGEDLFYLGWCHGPPGTLRLYHLLSELTGSYEYGDRVKAGAAALMACGLPEARPEGYWNNVSQCCGAAGISNFFIELHHACNEESYLEFAEELVDDILTRARKTEEGMSWIQAEHRVQPEFLQAQTGYMQGAAGIGLVLLHLRDARRGRHDWIRVPDSPFGESD